MASHLKMKCMATFPKYHRAFVSRIFAARSHTFKGRLTNPADFIVTARIPSPPRHAVKAFDSNLQARKIGRWLDVGKHVAIAGGNNGCIALSFPGAHDSMEIQDV